MGVAGIIKTTTTKFCFQRRYFGRSTQINLPITCQYFIKQPYISGNFFDQGPVRSAGEKQFAPPFSFRAEIGDKRFVIRQKGNIDRAAGGDLSFQIRPAAAKPDGHHENIQWVLP